MTKKRLDVDWKREIRKEDIKPAVKRYQRYLVDKGLRESSLPMYVLYVGKYLEFSGTNSYNADDFAKFCYHLHDMKRFRSATNN